MKNSVNNDKGNMYLIKNMDIEYKPFDRHVNDLIANSRNAYKGMVAEDGDGALGRWLGKETRDDVSLHSMESDANVRFSGPGALTVAGADEAEREGRPCLKLTCPTALPEVSKNQRSYAHAALSFDCGSRDMRMYNRISFWVRPDCPGYRNVWISVTINNQGAVSYPRA
ncbi:MAG: hypothetical protein FWH01_14820, partial [Oscillospiraceae bacterium]|nr:hypothetical protein [Oscillospiraceae bacterium]